MFVAQATRAFKIEATAAGLGLFPALLASVLKFAVRATNQPAAIQTLEAQSAMLADTSSTTSNAAALL